MSVIVSIVFYSNQNRFKGSSNEIITGSQSRRQTQIFNFKIRICIYLFSFIKKRASFSPFTKKNVLLKMQIIHLLSPLPVLFRHLTMQQELLMVLILDDNSEIDAHSPSLLFDLFKAFDCHTPFFSRKSILSFMRAQHVLSYYLI